MAYKNKMVQYPDDPPTAQGQQVANGQQGQAVDGQDAQQQPIPLTPVPQDGTQQTMVQGNPTYKPEDITTTNTPLVTTTTPQTTTVTTPQTTVLDKAALEQANDVIDKSNQRQNGQVTAKEKQEAKDKKAAEDGSTKTSKSVHGETPVSMDVGAKKGDYSGIIPQTKAPDVPSGDDIRRSVEEAKTKAQQGEDDVNGEDGFIAQYLRREMERNAPETKEQRERREKRERREVLMGKISDLFSAMHRAYAHARGIQPMAGTERSMSDKVRAWHEKARADREARGREYVNAATRLMTDERTRQYRQEQLDLNRQREQRLQEKQKIDTAYRDAKIKGEEAKTKKDEAMVAYWETKARLLAEGWPLEQANKMADIALKQARTAKLGGSTQPTITNGTTSGGGQPTSQKTNGNGGGSSKSSRSTKNGSIGRGGLTGRRSTSKQQVVKGGSAKDVRTGNISAKGKFSIHKK